MGKKNTLISPGEDFCGQEGKSILRSLEEHLQHRSILKAVALTAETE